MLPALRVFIMKIFYFMFSFFHLLAAKEIVCMLR